MPHPTISPNLSQPLPTSPHPLNVSLTYELLNIYDVSSVHLTTNTLDLCPTRWLYRKNNDNTCDAHLHGMLCWEITTDKLTDWLLKANNYNCHILEKSLITQLKTSEINAWKWHLMNIQCDKSVNFANRKLTDNGHELSLQTSTECIMTSCAVIWLCHLHI